MPSNISKKLVPNLRLNQMTSDLCQNPKFVVVVVNSKLQTSKAPFESQKHTTSTFTCVAYAALRRQSSVSRATLLICHKSRAASKVSVVLI